MRTPPFAGSKPTCLRRPDVYIPPELIIGAIITFIVYLIQTAAKDRS